MTIFVQDEAKWNSPNLLVHKPHELPHNPVHNPVVEQFTSDLFRDISLAEIPALDEIIQHVYSYNELATMLEMSPAHKNTRKIAAERLRDVSILLYEARDALHKMFVESKTKTKEISESLLKAQVEARDYNIDNDTGKRNFDLTTEAIDGIRNVRGYLNGTAVSLRVIHNKLKDYQLNINKVKINLGAAEYEITNESLQHLKAAVDLWRYSLKRSVLLMFYTFICKD
ncbi:15145_t:CDS:2 [Rhizophagus irregularis]|nr:15145_t:CDS:2 [Rhizophagus irregularis]